MEKSDFQELLNFWQSLKPGQKQRVLMVSIGIFVLLVVAVPLVFTASKESKPLIQVQKSTEVAQISKETKLVEVQLTPSPVKKIKVDIAGAVKFPGVYELPEESRLTDVLERAGGISEEADQDYISKYINLAQIVSDGDKIYIPRIGEGASESSSFTTAVTQQSGGQTAGTQSSHPVNINTASQAQLETLPYIGPVYASRIIESRPYQKIEDIMKVKGIGQKTFEKIKDLITVN